MPQNWAHSCDPQEYAMVFILFTNFGVSFRRIMFEGAYYFKIMNGNALYRCSNINERIASARKEGRILIGKDNETT